MIKIQTKKKKNRQPPQLKVSEWTENPFSAVHLIVITYTSNGVCHVCTIFNPNLVLTNCQ